jgi:predicted RNase H-like nuclease (RuvC/YqgF family)
MRRISKIFAAALVATTALGAALPAQAQSYHEGRYDRYDRHDRNDRGDFRTPARANAIRAQIADLQRRVERNDRSNRISEREAAGLRNAVYRLRDQFRDFNRNGLSPREMQILEARIQQVRQQLHIERSDWDNRRW